MGILDPRSVANVIIRMFLDYNKSITNLSLQKILYFIHGKFLIERNEPLVSGYFEAWRYGPVHPLVYDVFKDFGGANITKMATRRNITTGEVSVVEEPDDIELKFYIAEATMRYMSMSAGRLVDLSHAKGSPWDVLTKADGPDRVYGQRITNKHIEALFRNHIIAIDDKPRAGEPSEESLPS